MGVWTWAVWHTIEAQFISAQWIVAYVGKTDGAAQLCVLTTIMGVNIWRIAVKFWQERIISVKKQVAAGKSEGRNEVVTALLVKGVVSREQINAAIRESGNEDLISDIVSGRDSGVVVSDAVVNAMGRMTAASEALTDAVNRMNATSQKTECDCESEKSESEN